LKRSSDHIPDLPEFSSNRFHLLVRDSLFNQESVCEIRTRPLAKTGYGPLESIQFLPPSIFRQCCTNCPFNSGK
jgi:hypothetical protein